MQVNKHDSHPDPRLAIPDVCLNCQLLSFKRDGYVNDTILFKILDYTDIKTAFTDIHTRTHVCAVYQQIFSERKPLILPMLSGIQAAHWI